MRENVEKGNSEYDLNSLNILNELYDMIKDRSINKKEGSYTNYLLDQGIDKICKKVGEEATETVIAAKNESKDDLVGEICDLIYHIEVLMFNRNVEIKDVVVKLSERHKKVQNIRGEY